jgi:hypothetical protein
MRYEMVLFVMAALLLVFVSILYLVYLRKLYSRLYKLKKKEFKFRELYEMGWQPQGSNFTTAAIASWALFFICMGYLFFLTPELFDNISFLRISGLASSMLGFWLFSLGIMVITILLTAAIPRMYGFFEIPLRFKTVISFAVPILLIGSLISSAYLGTIYPAQNHLWWNLSYLLMIGGETTLLLPILFGVGSGIR